MNYLSTPAASSSHTRTISGTTPGLLDITQSQRLLRHPNSKLTFASYDPRTTSAGLQADPLLDSCKDRRVALDVLGTSVVWRPVPRAILDEGVTDEGHFPRVINICGQPVECSQDQWDIYKLDFKYHCHVHLPPALSTITLATPPVSGTASTRAEDTSNLSGKRARLVMENIRPVPPPLHPRKKLTHNKKLAPTDSPLGINHLSLSEDEDEKDESEVEEMIVDAAPPIRAKSAGPSDRTRRLREEINRNRQDRRVRVARRAEKLAQLDEFIPTNLDTTVPLGDAPAAAPEQEDASPDSLVKRKVTSLFNPYRDMDYAKPAEEGDRNMLYYEMTKTGNAKRVRTVSPTTAKRELGAKRHRREKARQKKREDGIKRRRKRWEDEFLAQLYAEVPELGETSSGSASNGSEANADNDDVDEDSESEEEEPDSEEVDEGALREAAIAESRRKLAELEKDRHLWEDEARKRAFRERAEQEAANLRREQMRFAEARQAELERQRRAEEEEAKRRREMDPRMRQERVRQQREKYRSHQWSSRPWTTQRAVDRYNQLCETFDSTKFCEEEPLVWEAVPWPVLTFPTQIRIGDIEWEAVEKFFDAAQRTMTIQQYRTFVVRSQHRFHPDRWSGRRLLKAVVDDSEREHIEITADRVSKALTPIWEKATRRNQ